jgi:hypothetical protein
MAEAVEGAILLRAVTEAADAGWVTVVTREGSEGAELEISGLVTRATLPLFEQLLLRGATVQVTLRATDLVRSTALER